MAVDDFGPFRERMAPFWNQSRVLLGGTNAMREAGSDYLPKFEAETSKNYQRRLSLATLTNFYVKARNNMVGEMFRDDVVYSDGSLPQDILDNLDLRGCSLTGFCERIAETLLTHAVCGVLIDHPINDGVENLRDQEARNLRHYWSFIKPEMVLDYVVTYVEGVETLTHVRWFEDHIVPSGEEFGFNYETRIIVLDREIIIDPETQRTVIGAPRGRIYASVNQDRENKNISDNKRHHQRLSLGGNFTPITDWMELRGYDEIPFVAFRVNKDGVFCGQPPLADIAEKNIQHWRQSSNYGNTLEIGAFPLLVRYNMNKKTPLSPDGKDLPKSATGESIVGPHIIMDVPSKLEGTEVVYVEPSGAAYSALERNLDRIVSEAELMAIDLLTKPLGSKTATEANYDRLQELAPLQRVAMEIERGVNRCLQITAAARARNEAPGRITINKDFGVTTSDALRIAALRDARAIGDLSAETYLRELQSIGALSATLDTKLEAQAALSNDDIIGGGDVRQ